MKRMGMGMGIGMMIVTNVGDLSELSLTESYRPVRLGEEASFWEGAPAVAWRDGTCTVLPRAPE
jgi:hypothetical protein